MRIRGFRKKLRTLVASRPGLERKALRFFHSIEETKQILDKTEKGAEKIAGYRSHPSQSR